MIYLSCVKIRLRQKEWAYTRSFLFAEKACMSKITEEVETIITPILDELNFELVEVEYTKRERSFLKNLY